MANLRRDRTSRAREPLSSVPSEGAAAAGRAPEEEALSRVRSHDFSDPRSFAAQPLVAELVASVSVMSGLPAEQPLVVARRTAFTSSVAGVCLGSAAYAALTVAAAEGACLLLQSSLSGQAYRLLLATLLGAAALVPPALLLGLVQAVAVGAYPEGAGIRGGLAGVGGWFVGFEQASLARGLARPVAVTATALVLAYLAASVGAETLWKGWLSVLLGLLIACIGTDPESGEARFAFDSYYLLAGIGFIPLILGFFAIAEIFTQAEKMVAGTRKEFKADMEFPSFLEFWRLRFTVLRSMGLGFFAGVLPGIGATLAAFLSYNETVRWSKTPEKFGKGELAGVVASETANNSATGAAMIPLLALGLPGGALTAMMMGVFQIHGMEPGPLVFMTSVDLVWVTFSAMFFANICILILGWVQTKTVVHLLRIPFRRLAPAIMLIATIGAYALRNLVVDVWVMYLAGIAGYFLRKTGYSVAGIVLGLILGKLGESAFVKSMQILDYDFTGFLDRPISMFLLAAGVITIGFNVRRALRTRAAK